MQNSFIRWAVTTVLIIVGGVFASQFVGDRTPAAAEVLAVDASQTDWYADVMANGSEWDKSFLADGEGANTSANADPAQSTDVASTIAWYVTPTVKFMPGATKGSSEDGNITIETAGGNISVTCQTEDTACTNVKDAVADALADLEAAHTE
jgi:hypothetical protein